LKTAWRTKELFMTCCIEHQRSRCVLWESVALPFDFRFFFSKVKSLAR